MELFFRPEFQVLRKSIHTSLIEQFDLAGEQLRSYDEFLNQGIADVFSMLPPAAAFHDNALYLMYFANPVVATPRVDEAATRAFAAGRRIEKPHDRLSQHHFRRCPH